MPEDTVPVEWDNSRGTASRHNPTHTYAEAGDYQITLTVKNAGGSDSKTTTVTVEPSAAPHPG
jgi:PKD repeat protein